MRSPIHEPAFQRPQPILLALLRMARLLLLHCCAMVVLSGCMATLQTGRGPEVSPPGPLPSATVTLARPTVPEALPSPSSPGSLAPDPATPTLATVTVTTAPVVSPVATPPPLSLPAAPTPTHEERWRAQQQDRVVFSGLTPFYTSGSELWWYDPINQQHVILGRITGNFEAQAQFVLRGQGVPALEVPYQVNVGYGLTALSPALLERIRAVGYESDWIETYIFLTPNVFPR